MKEYSGDVRGNVRVSNCPWECLRKLSWRNIREVSGKMFREVTSGMPDGIVMEEYSGDVLENVQVNNYSGNI